MPNTTPKLSINLAALPLDHLAATMAELAAARVDELYCFISDGVAAPLAGGGPALVQAVAGLSEIPVHVHAASAAPGRLVDALAAAGCRRLTVQLEGCPHPHRVLGQIRDAGMSPGVAVNPGTPLTGLDYLLSMAERVLVLGAEPGMAVPARNALYDRIKILNDNIRYREHRIEITVSGGLDVVAMGRAARFGADTVVVDLEEVLQPKEETLTESLALLRAALEVSEKIA